MERCGLTAKLFLTPFAQKLTMRRVLHLTRAEKLPKNMTTRSPESRRTWCLASTYTAVLVLALATVSLAQSPRSSASAGQPPRPDDSSTIRVNVRLVNVFTTVTDAHGVAVADLNKDNFKILEDGVPQTIS